MIRPHYKLEKGIIMMDNLSWQKCESCNSHIIVYKENEKVKIECSYCGREPEDLSFSIELEDDN